MRILFIGCIESLDAQLDFHINYYVNTDNELDKKIEIISKYVGEIGEEWHSTEAHHAITDTQRRSEELRKSGEYSG